MSKQNADSIGGGVFLIGLGVLFLLNWFWPGILLLIGIVALVNQSIKGEVVGGLVALLIFGGLTALFTFSFDWKIIGPIFLIVVGLIALVNALRGR
jgi:hypothetical protein